MKRLTDLEIQKARALKAYRSAIRLKYSLLADEEINATLPDISERFDAAIQAGKPFELTAGEVFEVVDRKPTRPKRS